MIDLKDAQWKYRKQAYHCRYRKDALGNPIEMRLTFDEWVKIWDDSGKWEQRGRRKDQYCMCRVNDVGNYEIGNVFIDTNANNSGEPGVSARRVATLMVTKVRKYNSPEEIRLANNEKMRRYRLRLKEKALQFS